MAQSETASTLITRTLLAVAEVGLPWFYTANYSLVWKLLGRPSEAIQRLIGHPIVVLPDPPMSQDWSALMKEFDVVLVHVFEFKLVDRSTDLWKLRSPSSLLNGSNVWFRVERCQITLKMEQFQVVRTSRKFRDMNQVPVVVLMLLR
jgi:hypothetical protein